MIYDSFTNDSTSFFGWTTGQTHYRIRLAGETCESVTDLFNSLTPSQKLAYATLLAAPVVPDDEDLTETFCGAASGTYAEVPDGEYFSDVPSGGGPGPINYTSTGTLDGYYQS